MVGIIHRADTDLPVDVPGGNERGTFHGVEVVGARFFFKRVEGFEIANSEEQRVLGNFETLVLQIGISHPD